MSEKEEKVFVITKKMIWTTSVIAIIFIIVGISIVWLINRGDNTAISKSHIISSSETVNSESAFTLKSDAGIDGGTLPTEYTCDGSSVSPQLSWSNPPSGTKEYAIMMTTLPVDGSTKWSWVLYDIPADTTSLAKGSTGIGTLGSYLQASPQIYHPPCSQGDGLNKYTFTVYALSKSPDVSTNQAEVTGESLTKAISNITLGSANLSLNYQRTK